MSDRKADLTGRNLVDFDLLKIYILFTHVLRRHPFVSVELCTAASVQRRLRVIYRPCICVPS